MKDLIEEKQEEGIIGVAVMASGEGTRFGSNKLLAEVGGRTVIERSLDLIDSTLFQAENVVVVTRTEEVEREARKRGFRTILHHFPKKSDTVRLATEELLYADGILFLQGDQFLLRRATIRRMVGKFRSDTEVPVRLGFCSQSASPVLFPRSAYEGLMHLKGDQGGAAVLSTYEKVHLVEAEEVSEIMDADTPQELTAMITMLREKEDPLPSARERELFQLPFQKGGTVWE